MRLLFNNLFGPEDAGVSGGLPELSADDILNELNKSDTKSEDNELPADDADDDDEGEESSDEKKDKDTKEEEKTEEEKKLEEELKEIEEDLKDPSDDDLDLKVPVSRRQLMKDYPDIFKKHPGLQSTIYRERAYTELLPTINDAKEALQALNTLNDFESDLSNGNTVKVLKATLEADPKAFAKLADNYMANLSEVDQNAYHHVIGNITKDIVEAMLKFGKDKENKEVLDSAATLYQFMFNSTKWEGKRKLSIDEVMDDSVNAERQKLEQEKKDFESSKQKEHTDKLMTSIDNQIKGTIEKSIDVKDQMTSFVKSKAIEEVLVKAKNLIEKDSRFKQIVKQLTDRATKEKFSDESLNRIRSTYYNKYKSILIPLIKAVRSEALKGRTTKMQKEEEVNDTTERANRDTTVRNDKGGNKIDKSKPLPGESSLDFLLRRA